MDLSRYSKILNMNKVHVAATIDTTRFMLAGLMPLDSKCTFKETSFLQ